MGAFLFLEDAPPINDRALFPGTLRYLELREEPSFGVASTLEPSYYGYRNFSFRVSGPRTLPGRYGPSSLTRNLQMSLPLLLDGRYRVNPRFGDPTVVYMGEAQRRLFDFLLARKATPSLASPGDLRSWEVAHHGKNAQESYRFIGCKTSSFEISSSRRKGRLNQMTLTIQVRTPGAQDSTWGGDELDTRISPRVGSAAMLMEASQLRIVESPTTVESDMLGSRVFEPSQFRLRCTRQFTSGAPYGHNSDAAVQIRELRSTSEHWTLGFSVPTWDTGGNPIPQELRDAVIGFTADRKRYNVRVDFGGVNKVLYVALPDAASAVASPTLWNYPAGQFDATSGVGNRSARVYAVYYSGSDREYTTEYVPLPSDMIRFQGDGGESGEISNHAGGGYATRVGSAVFAEGTLAPGWTGSTGYGAFISDIRDAVSPASPWPNGQRPQGHVSFWFDSQLHTPQDLWTRLVPGGFSVSMNGMVLIGSEGLDPNKSRHRFSLVSDTDTTIEVAY